MVHCSRLKHYVYPADEGEQAVEQQDTTDLAALGDENGEEVSLE